MAYGPAVAAAASHFEERVQTPRAQLLRVSQNARDAPIVTMIEPDHLSQQRDVLVGLRP